MKLSPIIFLILLIPSICFAEETIPMEPFLTKQQLEKKSSLPVSLIILEKKANAGDPDAQFEAGLFYFRGVTIERNLTKSIHYFSLAAEQNNQKALYNLGTLYIDGTLVEKNTEKGLGFLKRAVDTNYVPAQVAYAFLYIDGEILPKDLGKAYEWISIANMNKDISDDDKIELKKYKKNLEEQLTPEQRHAIQERIKHKF